MPTPVAYHEGLDKYLGVNDSGDAEVYDPKDLPKAVKAGRVTVTQGPTEFLSNGGRAFGSPPIPETDEDEDRIQGELADPNRQTVRLNPIESRVSNPTAAERVQMDLADPSRKTARVAELPPAAKPAPKVAKRAPMPPASKLSEADDTPAPSSSGPGRGFPGAVLQAAMGAGLKMPAAAQQAQTPQPSPPMYQPPPQPRYASADDLSDLQRKAWEQKRDALAIAAATGHAKGADFVAQQAALAGEPVQDFMQRVAFQQKQLLADRQRQMMDPSSPLSSHAKEGLAAAAPEFRGRFTDEQWARLSGNDLQQLGKPMEIILSKAAERATQEDLEGRRAADAKARSDATIAAENERADKNRTAEDKRARDRLGLGYYAVEHGTKQQALSDKELEDLKNDLDPNSRKAGNLRDNQNRINAAERLKALAQESNGDARNLTPQQMQELATGLNTLISGGSAGAAREIEALVPKSARGDGAALKQWLFNQPTGTNQQAFVRNMLETAERERGVAADQIKQGQAQRLAAHKTLFEKDPDAFHAVTSSYGFTPEEADAGVHGKKLAPASSGGPRPPQAGMVRIRDPKSGRTGWAHPEDIPAGAERI